MGDTPRSQTISTQNRRIVEQATCKANRAKLMQNNDGGKPPLLVGEVSLSNVFMLAKKNPEMIFTSLTHRIDLSLLKEALRRIKKGAATGVDGVTSMSYVVP